MDMITFRLDWGLANPLIDFVATLSTCFILPSAYTYSATASIVISGEDLHLAWLEFYCLTFSLFKCNGYSFKSYVCVHTLIGLR